MLGLLITYHIIESFTFRVFRNHCGSNMSVANIELRTVLVEDTEAFTNIRGQAFPRLFFLSDRTHSRIQLVVAINLRFSKYSGRRFGIFKIVVSHHTLRAVVLFFYGTVSIAACSRPMHPAVVSERCHPDCWIDRGSFVEDRWRRISHAGYHPITSFQQARFTNFTGWSRQFRINVLDEKACTIAAMREPKISTSWKFLSARLKVSPSGEGVELELHNGGKQSHSLFKADGLPNKTPAMWSADSPASKTHLIDVINSFPEGISNGSGEFTRATSSCNRF